MNHWIRPAHLQVILILLFVKGNLFSAVNGLTSKDPSSKGSSYHEYYPWGEFADEKTEDVSSADIYQSLNYLIDLMELMLTKLHEKGLLSSQHLYRDVIMENPASWSVLLQPSPPKYPGNFNRFAPNFNPPPINPEDRGNQVMYPQHISENLLTHPYIPLSPPPFFGADHFGSFVNSIQIPTDKYDMFPTLPQHMLQSYDKIPHLKTISVNPPPINPDDPFPMQDLLSQESRNNELYSTLYHGRSDPSQSGPSGRDDAILWPWNPEVKQRMKVNKSALGD